MTLKKKILNKIKAISVSLEKEWCGLKLLSLLLISGFVLIARGSPDNIAYWTLQILSYLEHLNSYGFIIYGAIGMVLSMYFRLYIIFFY